MRTQLIAIVAWIAFVSLFSVGTAMLGAPTPSAPQTAEIETLTGSELAALTRSQR